MIPKAKRDAPYFQRAVIAPPQEYDRYQVLDYEASLAAVEVSELSAGQKDLIKGLLIFGSTKRFPGGIGLDYDQVYKYLFIPQFAWKLIQEIANQFKGKVDAILMPERSAVIPGSLLMAALDRVPVLRLEKNGGFDGDRFAFQVDSYTGGGRDVISVRTSAVQGLQNFYGSGPVRLLLADEILDTGSMARGVVDQSGLVYQCWQAGFEMCLVGAATLMEKQYTGAAKSLEDLGLQVVSGTVIEDLWLDSPYGPGMKVFGIESGLTFNQL